MKSYKKEIFVELSKVFGTNYQNTALIWQKVIIVIKKELLTAQKDGRSPKVFFKNFGTFTLKKRTSRRVFNFKTNRAEVIPDQAVVKFAISRCFKTEVAKFLPLENLDLSIKPKI